MGGLRQMSVDVEQEGMKGLIVLAACLIVLSLVPSCLADGGRGHAGGEYTQDFMAVPPVGLTAEQVARIQAARRAHLDAVRPLQARLFSKRSELRSLWLKRNPDPERIAAAQQELSALRAQLNDRRVAYERDVRSVLRPDQQRRMGGISGWRGGAAGRVERHGAPRTGANAYWRAPGAPAGPRQTPGNVSPLQRGGRRMGAMPPWGGGEVCRAPAPRGERR
jgi:Spy/CpxP family protein refolding chaperone